MQKYLLQLLCFLIFSLPAICQENKGDELLDLSQEQAQKEQFTLATKSALDAASFYKDSPERAGDWIAAKLFAVRCATYSEDYTLIDAKNLLEEALEQSPLSVDDPLLGRMYVYKGWFLANQLADFENAKSAYEEALHLATSDTKKVVTPTAGKDIYKPLAQIYIRLGENEKAEALLEKAVKTMKDNGQGYFIPELYVDWGLLYRDLGEHKAAFDKYEAGLLAHSDFWGPGPIEPDYQEDYDNIKGYLLANKAYALFSLGKKAEAESVCQQGLSLLTWEDYRAAALGIMADFKTNVTDAIPLLQEAISYAKNYYPAYSRTIAKYELGLSDAYLSSGAGANTNVDIQNALQYAQQALARVVSGVSANDFKKLPGLEILYPENTIMEALEQKANIFYARYIQTRDLEDLELAADHYGLSIEMEKILNDAYTYQSSLLTMAEQSHLRHEKALKVLFELYSKTNKKRFLEKAYAMMESSRAVVLHRLLAQQKALQTISNTSLLEKEQALSVQIADYQRLRFELELSGAASEEIEAVKTEVFNLKNAYDRLIKEVETTEPAYFQARYQTEIASIASIAKQLSSNELLVEYFWANEEQMIYQISVSGDGQIHFLKQAIPTDFSIMRKELTDWTFIQNNEGDSLLFQQLCGRLANLYNLLLPESTLTNNLKRLIVIPDGQLSFIPFDILLTESPPKGPVDYASLPYLIKQTAVQYAFSGSSLTFKNQKKRKNMKNYLGVAPEYQGSSFLSNVRNNASAVLALEDKLGGDCLIRQEANPQEFKEKVSDYRIIHFYGHAKAYPDYPEASWLAFSGENNPNRPIASNSAVNNGLLGTTAVGIPNEELSRLIFLFELSQLNMQSDLVVLSACETGTGQVAIGEGVISLARAFSYAGCPSTITSLWEANDYRGEVAFLTETFFDNIWSRMSKEEALRQAKLAYLERPGMSKYPAYWASFVLIGDHTPINFNAPGPNLYFYAAIGAVLFLLLFLWIKNQKA